MGSKKPSRIVELSETIQSNTRIIDSYFESEGLPPISFDVEYPSNLPPHVTQARDRVLEATDELSDLMLGAQQLAECHPPQHTSLIGFQAIARWDIANKLGEDEEITFRELAERCNKPEDDFTRILRQAVSKHIFKEPSPGIIAHNAASKLYRRQPGLKDYISVALDDIWPSATRMLDAMDKWDHSQESNHTGFNLSEGTEESYLQTMRTNSKRRTAFSNVMKHMQTRPGFGSSVTHLLSSFDWASVHKVVDIGGGLGETCKQIIEHTSTFGTTTLHCVVQDLPDVIAEIQSQELDEKYGERLSFLGHDFFQDQPVKDADVYLLRWILHDWSDANATKILNRLIPALKPGANVIIHEFVVPPSGSVPFYYEKTIRCMDLAMKATFNSKERDIDAWSKLFTDVDTRFNLVDTNIGAGNTLAMLRFVWQGIN